MEMVTPVEMGAGPAKKTGRIAADIVLILLAEEINLARAKTRQLLALGRPDVLPDVRFAPEVVIP